LTSNIET